MQKQVRKVGRWFIMSSILWFKIASAQQSLGLQEAWGKVAPNSIEILSQKQSEQLQKEKARQLRWWDDPIVDYSQMTKSLQGTNSRVTTLGVRQKLPFGADRTAESVLEQGLVKWEESKTQTLERSQQNSFVRWLYQFKIAGIEKEHIAERLQRLQAIKSHLNKTQAYTPSSQLERDLIEIRLRELDLMKLQIDSRWREAYETLMSWGVSPEKTQVRIPWIEASVIEKSISNENSAPLALQGWEALVSAKKSRADGSVWKPQFEVFFSEMRESGGAAEEDRTFGLAMTLPLFSGFSPKKNQKLVEAKAEELKLEAFRRDTNLEWGALKSKSQVVMTSLKMFPISGVAKLEKKVDVFEEALKRKQISVMQFLDYESRTHEQVESAYSSQLEAVNILSALNLRSEKNIVEVLEALNEPAH